MVIKLQMKVRKLKIEPSIKHEVIELFDKEKNQKIFYIKNNNEWQQISEQEYNNITRG